jgi:hypothetical protein
MVSIFIMFDSSRREQLMATLTFLEKMPEFQKAQKILLADDKPGFKPPGFELLVVPRTNGKFVWGNMWQAGVEASIYDNIFYIDSDRLLPPNFLTLALERLSEKTFIFTSRHFMMLKPDNDFVDLWNRVDQNFQTPVVEDVELTKLVKYDIRQKYPHHGPGKNVMSGSTVFKKQTFLELGGVDRFYSGHGAFADTDFHMMAFQAGCQFIDLNVTELHCYHNKDNLSRRAIEFLSLNNFIYYLWKWKLPHDFAYDMADNLKINPDYVYKKTKEYAKEFDQTISAYSLED